MARSPVSESPCMATVKRRALSGEPCGTPNFTSRELDFSAPVSTVSLLFVKKEYITSRMLPVNPHFFS